MNISSKTMCSVGQMYFIISLTWLSFVLYHPVETFNVDILSALTHHGQDESYFGFSVDVHQDRGISWLLVGAPRATTSQPGVTRGGAVFRCSIASADSCQLIPFDQIGNNNASGQQIDVKSNQWFGATVRSSGPNGAVVACAPRYIWYSSNYKRREPVGTCFVARESFSEFSEYSPCRTSNWGYHRQGSCQAGLGAAISPDGQRLFIGAVGSWYWQGQVYSINTSYPAVRSPIFRTFVTGQVFSQGMFSRLDVLSTSEGSAAEDDSYLGYSAAVGDFNGDGKTDVAVGMPRGANLTGKVVLFTSTLTNIHNITGQQLGSYFGYCLAVADMDGDERDDVIVGAPLYTNYANTEGKYETGRVYVVYQSQRNSFRRFDVLDGENSKARFGLSVAALGDINLDGYKDIAVGAPYDGPLEKGAVYIFHGSSKGVKPKATQVIFAEDITTQLSTFGFSLSGGLDLDGNRYPDLLVGAYESDRVVYLKSRPVVNMTIVDISYDIESKQIDLDNKTCNLLDGTSVACVPLTFCLEYTGEGVEERLELDIQLVLDTKKPKNPRLHFLSTEGKSTLNQSVTLTKRNKYCKTHFVYIRPLIRDKLTVIESEVKYSLRELPESTRRRRRSLTPVLGVDPSPSKSDVLVIQKNCGRDNICIPDMQVTAKTNIESYIMGSGSRLEIEVNVLNAAEDAFEATFYLFLPPEVAFVNTDRGEGSDAAILCSPPSEETGYVLKCDIGNPLPAYSTAVFRVQLQPNANLAREKAALAAAAGEKVRSSLEFALEVNSTNPEEPSQTEDNKLYISMPIRVETDVILRGISDPEIAAFNLSAYSAIENRTEESHIGPLITHVYEIGNRGPSDILNIDIYILWPSRTLSGKELLYLVDYPNVDGPAKCAALDQFNPLALKLERDKDSGTTSSLSSSSSSQWTKTTSSSKTIIQGGTKTSGTTVSQQTITSSSGQQSTVSRGESAKGGSTGHRISTSSSATSQTSGTEQSGTFYGSDGEQISSSSISRSSGSRVTGAGQGSNVNQATTTYRHTSRGSHTIENTEEKQYSGGSGRVSSWNSSTTVTRYGPDGQAETTVTRTSGTGAPPGYESGPWYNQDLNSESQSRSSSSGTAGRSGSIVTYRRASSRVPSDEKDINDQVQLSRNRRATETDLELKKELGCGQTQCTVIACNVGPMARNDRVVFKLRARIWAQTIAEIDWEDLTISSKLVSKVTELPYGAEPDYLPIKTETVTTKLDQLDKKQEAQPIPWWIILLSVLAGVLLLLLLIFALWKLGFFKRKRPEGVEHQEQQEPLNEKNGRMHHGDEAL